MSFFSNLTGKIKKALVGDTPNAPKTEVVPDYVKPKAYTVKLDKNVFLMHYGLNRHQRRSLNKLYDNFVPSKQFPTRSSVSKALKASPDNFPLRRVMLNDKKTYLLEPEYRDLIAKMKEFEAGMFTPAPSVETAANYA